VDTLPVFYNAKSGQGVEASVLAAACAKGPLAVEAVELPAGDDAADVFAAWQARRPSLWIAAGGDGTVGRVAAAAMAVDGTLGVLPMGTRNHFARDLGLPLELDAAVSVLCGGIDRAVDVGDQDGALFLNNASLGLYNQFVLVREHERRRPHMALWPALAKAAWHALRRAHDLDVELTADGEQWHARTPMLLVGNNVYTVQGLERGRRERLDAGTLSVYALHPRSRAGLVWLGLRALVGAVSAERDFDALRTDALTVRASQPELDVALDGETRRVRVPLRFRVRPGALRVRVPAPEAKENA
jgi:diacylglycerol kinase family enzyme